MDYCVFVLLVTLALASVSASIAKEDGGENKEYFRPTMAPNSKFLNPHLDDATNLQLAISAFADALDEVDTGEESIDSSSNSSGAESNDEVDHDQVNADRAAGRKAKNLNYLNAISYLNSILAKKVKSA
ncbi:hypothetical protein RUM43_010113 [Polyplax serrata]|uniref:Uncharacterized protein n=1 Tax=Polyplax serrata TaxID=468196 RepID=A0AAN8PKE4_POLSC